ncbi:integrin beta-1-B-like [Xenia sp. Carnegie-2017]|uniref:integrin beta-1-B-like n=1 Tax=Xenia sp. Carnegie-2017 TaxID=2897299 RepID=UPI001F047B4B|nr:integrin beta-1-B-like [Xenia sp. Carnegie-2017]
MNNFTFSLLFCCIRSPGTDDRSCSNVKPGETVEFSVTATVTSCEKHGNSTSFLINAAGFGSIQVDLEVICRCDCEDIKVILQCDALEACQGSFQRKSDHTKELKIKRSSPPKCRRCRNHGIFVNVKGNKQNCVYKHCKCNLCMNTEKERRQTAARIAIYRKGKRLFESDDEMQEPRGEKGKIIKQRAKPISKVIKSESNKRKQTCSA